MSETFGAMLEARGETIRAIIADGERLADSLGARGEATAGRMRGAVDALATLFEDKTTHLSADMADVLETRGGDVLTRLESLSTALAETVAARTGELSETIEAKGGALVASMDAGGQKLHGQVLEITQRLADTAALVTTSTSTATRDLGQVEVQLADRAAALRELLDRLALEATDASGVLGERIETMRDTAAHIGTDVAALSERFEAQATSLAAAARAVGAVNQRIEQGLGEREARLAAVSAEVGGQVEAIETRVQAMAEQLEGTLTRAQARSSEASEALTNAALSAERAFGERIEALRDAATSQGQDVSEAVRATYESAVGDISRALDQAVARYTESAGEMRGISETIRTEMEGTRELLKAAAIDIPKETEEGARNMRRVISEQIKALRELSNIAARQPGRLDIDAPSLDAPTAAVARPSAAPASVTRQTPRGEERETVVTSSVPSPAPREEEHRPVADVPASRVVEDPALSQDLEAALREALEQPKPALRSTEGRAASQPANGAGTAPSTAAETAAPRTRKEVPANRTPVHMVESLNSLSVDIARAIDHDAFLSLWDRYKEGERNVFTRRLYTLQGQKTYDDIRRRYARDKEFRTAVERYLEDFENLLRQVAKDDPKGNAAQDYLMSETGKVYTMLAHTSGRLS